MGFFSRNGVLEEDMETFPEDIFELGEARIVCGFKRARVGGDLKMEE